MIKLFKKPEVVIVRDVNGKVLYVQYDENVDIRYKTIKSEIIDSGSLERRVSNLEVRMDTDNYTPYYDDSNIPILKKGMKEPKIPTVLPETNKRRGW